MRYTSGAIGGFGRAADIALPVVSVRRSFLLKDDGLLPVSPLNALLRIFCHAITLRDPYAIRLYTLDPYWELHFNRTQSGLNNEHYTT